MRSWALLLLSVFSGMILTRSVAAEEPDNGLGQFKTHLEFLGYDCKDKPGETGPRLSCKTKEAVPDMHIQAKGHGFLVTFYRIATAEGKRDEPGMLSLINKLNSDAMASRFYRDEAGDLIMEGFYPGEYNKDMFSRFTSTFQDDWKRLVEKYESELNKLVNM